MGFIQWPYRKKILAIVFICITLLYTIIGVFLFTDIEMMQSPKITAHIELLEITAEDARIHLSFTVNNPNTFSIITKDFFITLYTEDTKEITRINLDGGVIPGNNNKTFETTHSINLKNDPLNTVYVDIQSRVGATFLHVITKTMPLQITVISPLKPIIDRLAAPKIHLKADLTDITQKGVNLTATIDITNPNTFEMQLTNTSVEILTNTNEIAGDITIPDIIVQANQTRTLDLTGFINIEALNAESLQLLLSSNAKLRIAGTEKTLPIRTSADITMPDIGALLSQTIPTDFTFKGDYKLTRKGILVNVTIEIHNPNAIDIQAKDLSVSVHRVDGDQETFIAETNVNGGIAKKGSSLHVMSDLLIPYTSLLVAPGHFGLPDWLLVSIYSNMSVPGLDVSLWVGISEYQDMKILRHHN